MDLKGHLHLYVNGIDQGVAAKDIPPQCYALVDLYGQCEEVCCYYSNIVVLIRKCSHWLEFIVSLEEDNNNTLESQKNIVKFS